MTEIIRKDAKERILGDKSYVGDQEIIGKFQVKDSNGNLIFEFDPNAGKLYIKDTSGNGIFEFNSSNGDLNIKDTAGNTIFEFDVSETAVNVGGDSNVKIDGGNKRILINDGTTNRGVFGNV